MTTPSPAQQLVADSADTAGLHATVPALLLELQTHLGILAATATTATERGRRPFRPTPDWGRRLGELAYGVYLLADQSEVDVETELRRAADAVAAQARQAAAQADRDWPFEAR